MRQIRVILIAIFAFVAPAMAQPLADRVPEDATFYLGWCGGDSMPSEFQGSHLKAVLDASNLPAVFSEFLPSLIARTALQDRQAGEKLNMLTSILGPMWRHPTAIYFSGIDVNAPQPMPHAGIICQAGADLQSIVERLTQIKQQSHGEAPINWVTDKDTVTVFIGAQPDAPGKGLVNSATFKTAMAKVKPGSALAFYLDGERAIAMIDQGIKKGNDPQAMAYWPKVLNSSGLAGLGRVVGTAGFDGKEWMDEAFVEAPAPRKGLLAWGDAPPLPDELLKCVPATATYVSAGAFDAAAFIESIRAMVGDVDKAAQGKVDQGLGIVSMMLGKNLQRDVLEPLGPHWVAYVDPNTAGIGFAGLVVINKLDDPQKASAGLSAIAIAVSNLSAAAMKQQHMSIPTRQTKVGDITVTYLAAPLITPSWTIQGDKLFIGLYPQVVATAARNAAAAGKQSILDNPDYLAVRKRLGGSNASAIQYVDLRKTAAEGYQSLLMVSRLAMGVADMWGVNSPEIVLPTFDDLMKHLAPMGSVTWAEADGFHMRSISPFPGSEVLAGSQGAFSPVVGSAVMASVLLPSLNRAKETANRVKCASNMRQIGQAMMLHANDHKGAFPDTMGELLQQDITLDIFVCPTHGTTVPPQMAIADPAMKAGWVDSSGDYVYLGAGKDVNMKAPGQTIMLYERPGNHGGDGINMLFGDGHVEFVQMGRAQAMIAQQPKPARAH